MSALPMLDIPQWTLGDRLRKARVHNGLDQSEMARKLGVAQTAVAKWEADQRRPRDLLAVVDHWAEITGVPREWLMFGVVPTTDRFNGRWRAVLDEAGPPHLPLPGDFG